MGAGKALVLTAHFQEFAGFLNVLNMNPIEVWGQETKVGTLRPFSSFSTSLLVSCEPPLPLHTFHIRIAILILAQPQCLSFVLMARWF